MENKRYQVFISSTFKDLALEREQVIKQILTMGHIPVGMEMFSADDEEQWGIIQREIDRSDYYVVIVKQRYGSIIKKENNIGFTEKEYDYAGTAGVPRLGFVVADGVAVLPEHMEESPSLKRKLDAFKKKIMDKPVSFFHSPEELGIQVLQALTKQIARGGRLGWERATEDSRETLNSFRRLSDENAALRAENDRLRALAAEDIPGLDCQFVNDDDEPIGRSLVFSPPAEITLKTAAEFSLATINSLVDGLDEVQRKVGYIGRSKGPFGLSSLDEKDYNFSYSRVHRVKQLLHAAGATAPKEDWTFDDLGVSYIASSAALVPGNHHAPDPDRGGDLEKYNIFRRLANLLWRADEAVKQHHYAHRHCAVRLQLLNTSRVSAENLTVRFEFGEETEAGHFPLDLEERPKPERYAKIVQEIELLPANDAAELDEVVVGVPEGVDGITFNVRITGRNLPEAQIIPLSIVRGEVELT
ncbi:DUF4062 domain-containing protein [Deinococcus fonticola]|uniref:DUF4062 domain-containing protein n=1 Tax=Deinococcus fonticola TaxID=2528713 RepID=UPI0010752830|nr:DUF4062 domain-containing protein [Deinococcus fonticola]